MANPYTEQVENIVRSYETNADKCIRPEHADIISKYLEAGGSPNIRNTDGWTLLRMASRHGCIEIMKMLIDAGAAIDPSVLSAAATNGSVEAIKLLVSAGADPNHPTHPPLLSAVGGHHCDAIKTLVDLGADVNAVVGKFTALDRSTGYISRDVTKTLLAVGAKYTALSPKEAVDAYLNG